jgi:hypothetical protein
VIDRPSERFSARAAAYAQNRPGYPPEALDALLAGLGAPERLTIAEPNHSMAEQAEPDPRIEWIDGTGEDTRLPDRSVDVAAAFQAFHWFDPQAAIAEFKRISRRRIAVLQYERDEREEFGAAYGALVRRFATEAIEERRAQTLATFARLAGPNVSRSEHPYVQSLGHDELLGRMASTSYLPRDGAQADELRSEASVLFERFAQNERVSLAMVCYVLRSDA